MLTMIIMIAVMVGIFRLLGFELRIFGRILGWLIGMMVLFAVLGGIFGLIGAAASLAVHLLPVAILVGIGVLIGRRIGSSGSGWREYISGRTQEVLDASGRVISR